MDRLMRLWWMELKIGDDVLKKKYKIILGLTALPVSFFLSTITIFAEDVTWQQNNAEILSNNSVMEDGIRWISWGIIKFLCIIADIAASLYDKTFGMIDITQYPQLEGLVSSFKPVLVGLMILCLIGLGISYMVMQQKKNLVRNILISGLVLTSTIYMFSAANDLVSGFKGAVLDKNKGSAAYEIINNNLIDLVGVDKSGSISSLNYKKGRGIIHNAGVKDKESLDNINFRETLNWNDSDKGQNLYGWSETFNNYLRYKTVNIYGKYEGIEVYDGVVGGIGNEFYYRYSFDFWTAALEIFAMVLVYVALSYKNVRISYELIISRLLAFFFSSDVGSGERLKAVLFFIRDTYIALCISIMSIKIFLILTEAITSFGITGIAKGLVAMFIAYAVIDGPNISERILGIDAGLSSSVGRTIAILGLAKAGVRLAHSGISEAGNIGATIATGKTKQQRRSDVGYSTLGERLSMAAHKKFISADKEKSGGSEKTAEGNISTSFMGDTERTENNKSGSAVISEANVNSKVDAQTETSKSLYDNPSFMSEQGSSSAGLSTTAKPGISDKSTVPSTPDASTFSSTRYENPEFKAKMKELAPGKDASIGERRDFNRQVNNIVRGDHKAIKPDVNSRADYKETNYIKALALEKAYNSKRREDRDGKK